MNIVFARRKTKRDYLLRGLIFCPCGQRRTGEGVQDHLYYRCIDRINRFPLPRECETASVNVNVVDTTVWNNLVEMLTNPELMLKQAERFLEKRQTGGGDRSVMASIEREKEQLRVEEERYAKSYGEGLTSIEVYRSLNEGVNRRRDALDKQFASLHASNHDQHDEISAEDLVSLAQEVVSALDFSDRQYIVRQLVEKVVASPDEVVVTGHISVETLSHIGLQIEDRDCWSSKCWKVHSL